MTTVLVEVEDHDVVIEVPSYTIDVTVPSYSVDVAVVGSPGPPGPSAVSADAGNIATLGSDSLIFVAVPELPDDVITGSGTVSQVGVFTAEGDLLGAVPVTVSAYGQLQINTSQGQPVEGGLFLKNPAGQHVVLFPDNNGALNIADWLGTRRPIVVDSIKASNNIQMAGGGILWTATDKFLYVKNGVLSSANGMAVLQPFAIGEPVAAEHAATKQYVDSKTAPIPESDALHNTAYGLNAIPVGATGQNNTALGENALAALTTGSTNCAFGVNALAAVNTGGYNMAIGMNAGVAITSQNSNTLIGPNAGWACTANENTAIGRNALMNATTGPSNTAIGMSAGLGITTNGGNIAIGKNSLLEGNAVQNVAIGTSALNKSAGTGNVGVGYQALFNVTTGFRNVAIGYNAGTNPNNVIANATTTGSYQTLIGYNTGQATAGVTDDLTAIGNNAIGGVHATAVGTNTQALGQYSLALGKKATAGQNGAVAIGTDSSGAGATTAALNEIAIGTAMHNVKVAGTLTVAAPTANGHAATKQYVDQVVTVSASDPTGVPVRDGLLWVKV